MTVDITTRRSAAAFPQALKALAAGDPVVLLDEERDEGDLVYAAAHATTTITAFAIRHSSGFLGVALTAEACNTLRLPPVADTTDCAQRVSADLAGSGTGISAADRAATIAALADPTRDFTHFTRPGHVVPFRAAPGGLLAVRGRPEAACDLAALAGEVPAAAFATIVSTDEVGEMAHARELTAFATEHGLPLVTVAELENRLRFARPVVERAATIDLPTDHGPFETLGYRGSGDGTSHVALSAGHLADMVPVPVYVHQECLTGDVLRSTACQCRSRLDEAMTTVKELGHGLVIYTRPTGPARACGLFDQAGGIAPIDGITASARVAASVLADLGVGTVQLLDAPPALTDALRRSGIDVLDPTPSHALVS